MTNANANNALDKKDDDLMAKVNERNRKANVEAVRKAESAEADRRRRERKAALLGIRPSTPSDQSARLRTIPRLFETSSRNGTPGGSPMLAAVAANNKDTPERSISPLPPSAIGDPSLSKPVPQKKTFGSLAVNVDIDLGDF